MTSLTKTTLEFLVTSWIVTLITVEYCYISCRQIQNAFCNCMLVLIKNDYNEWNFTVYMTCTCFTQARFIHHWNTYKKRTRDELKPQLWQLVNHSTYMYCIRDYKVCTSRMFMYCRYRTKQIASSLHWNWQMLVTNTERPVEFYCLLQIPNNKELD